MRTAFASRATARVACLGAVLLLAACTVLQPHAADGLQWSIQPQGVGTAADADWRMAYGKGQLIAVSAPDIGKYVWDESGAWNQVDSRGGIEVAFGNGQFVAVNGYPRTYSEDGVLWLLSPDVPPNAASVVVYGRGRFVSVGMDAGSEIEMLATSELGVHWAILPSELDVNPRAPGVLAFGKGKFVLSDHLTLRTSMNLTDWPLTYLKGPGVSHSIRSVAFGGGLFVAAGEGGQLPDGEVVLTSADAMTWTVHQHAHNEAPCRGLCYGNGLFAGGGPDGTLYTSSDGVNWAVTKLDTSSEFEDVVFAEGRFAAVARDGTYALSEKKAPSVEEIRFRVRDSFRLEDGAMLLTVEGPYGQPVAVEASEDMVNWEEITTDPCDRGEFEVYDEAAAGLPHRFYRAVEWDPPAPDPLSQWAQVSTIGGGSEPLDWRLAFGNGAFVAVEAKELDVGDWTGSAWASPDAVTWEQTSSAPHRRVVFGAGQFMSWGGPVPMTSSNGQDWVQHEVVAPDMVLNGLTFGRNRFMGVADPVNGGEPWQLTYLRSIAGAEWLKELVPDYSAGFEGGRMVYGEGRMLYLDLVKLISSADGQHWKYEIDYFGGGGLVPPRLYCVSHGKGLFAVTGSNRYYTSEDGLTWTSQEDVRPDRMTYANGTFVGAGWNQLQDTTDFYRSTGGLSWSVVARLKSGETPSDVVFASGRFYVVTESGNVFRSNVMPSHVSEPRVIPELTYRLPDDAMLVTVEAPYGHEVVVEGSEDLETWQEIGRDPCDRGEFEIYHETAPPGTNWFYRARQVEP